MGGKCFVFMYPHLCPLVAGTFGEGKRKGRKSLQDALEKMTQAGGELHLVPCHQLGRLGPIPPSPPAEASAAEYLWPGGIAFVSPSTCGVQTWLKDREKWYLSLQRLQ